MGFVALSILALLTANAAAASLPGSEHVVLSGSFAQAAVPKLAREEMVRGFVFGEWPGRAVAGGRGSTGVFTAPAAIEFEVAGMAKSPHIRIYLEDAGNPAHTVDLGVVRHSYTTWHRRQWVLPAAWRGLPARLVVEDRSISGNESWVGVSLPREAHLLDWSKVKATGAMAASLSVQWLVLILPGFAAALWFARGKQDSAPRLLTILLAGNGVCAAGCFFGFVCGVSVGKLFGGAVYLVSAGVVAIHQKRITPLLRTAVGPVLVLWVTCASFYMSAALLYSSDDAVAEEIQFRFFTYPMPPDNLLPSILAEKLYQQEPYRPFLFADWQSSDRPPLQTGFALFQRGLWSSPSDQNFLLGVLLQTSWIPALWVFLRRVDISGTALWAAIAVPALSQFAFLHGTFVWPKLLAAAYGLLALSCFGWLGERKTLEVDAVLGGVVTGLAMLSHTGVLFTLLGFGLVAVFRNRFNWRKLGIFTATAALLYLPWVLYQKLWDPPGDALLKLHLAGTVDRTRSLASLVRESYSRYGFSGWLAAKWVNFKYLFCASEFSRFAHGVGQTALGISELHFFHLIPALGFANAGFVFRFRSGGNQHKVADRILVICGVSLAIWFLTMLVPQATAVHQGSLMTVLLLFSALTLYVAGYGRRALGILVALQFAAFVLFTILAKPLMERAEPALPDLFPDLGMFGLFGFVSTILGVWLFRTWRSESPLT